MPEFASIAIMQEDSCANRSFPNGANSSNKKCCKNVYIVILMLVVLEAAKWTKLSTIFLSPLINFPYKKDGILQFLGN